MVERRGAYTAERAAALSGVPWSTVHEWSRKARGKPALLTPSISPTRVKLWSYSDLLGLRVIYWLRHPKPAGDGEEIPATSMPEVRAALDELAHLDLDLFEEGSPTVRVDRGGHIHFAARGEVADRKGRPELDTLDLIRPFESEEGLLGPDLVRPRPKLRIIPGKLAGAPHIERTRLETEALAALARRSRDSMGVNRLYPNFDRQAIDQGLDLERQLARNLQPDQVAA